MKIEINICKSVFEYIKYLSKFKKHYNLPKIQLFLVKFLGMHKTANKKLLKSL